MRSDKADSLFVILPRSVDGTSEPGAELLDGLRFHGPLTYLARLFGPGLGGIESVTPVFLHHGHSGMGRSPTSTCTNFSGSRWKT